MGRCATSCLFIFVLLAGSGCVRRTISITSTPPGALVWLNDREVGRTPLEVGFLYYGEYDVRLAKEGYEPLHTSGKADPPLWDLPGPDLVSELMPVDAKSRIEWTFDLEPVKEDEAGLLDRAHELRKQLETAETETESTPIVDSGR